MFASRTAWNLAQNRFTLALNAHQAAGKPVIDLTVSNPTDCGFTYPAELLKDLASPAGFSYAPVAQGLLAARDAVSSYYAAKSLDVRPEHIFLTTGTSEAYSFLFRLLCEPGDEILLPAPGYPLFDFLAGLQDVRLIHFPLFYDHGWHIDSAALAAAITPRTKAIVLVNPNNPTGSFVKKNEFDEINRLCKQHDLAIISDEVFHDYSAGSQQPLSFVQNERALTFTLSGLSKVAGLPQMKVGWIAVTGPDAVRQKAIERLDVISDTYLSVCTPVQQALAALLGSRAGFQSQLNRRLTSNLNSLDALISPHKAVTRLALEGGWYAVLRVPVTQSDEELCIALLEKRNVLVQPGHFYDFPQEGHLILSLMTEEKHFVSGVTALLTELVSR